MRGAAAVCVAVALAGAVQAQGHSPGKSWVALIEACAGYAETGSRKAVFDGWDVAFDGGGVCNGDPACEDDDMTFVPPIGTGAVTVRVGAADWVGARYFDGGEDVVGAYPAHAFCRSAEGAGFVTAEVETATGLWAVYGRDAGRIVPAEGYVGIKSGPYIGCGYDGRRYLIEFSLARPGQAILRMNYPTRVMPVTPLTCAGSVS